MYSFFSSERRPSLCLHALLADERNAFGLLAGGLISIRLTAGAFR
jgi:hypothetical protein